MYSVKSTITIRPELYTHLNSSRTAEPATISLAARAFRGPTVWNSLGVHSHSADTFLTFKNRLKTELFKSYFL